MKNKFGLKKLGTKKIELKKIGSKKIGPKKIWAEKFGPKNLGQKIWEEIFSQIKFTNKNNQQNSSKDQKQKIEKSEHFLRRPYEKRRKD